MRGGNAAEIAKLGLRLSLHRADVSIGRDPYVNRVASLLDHRGITPSSTWVRTSDSSPA